MRFFKPYTIWLPTIWGLIAVLVLISAISLFCIRNLGFFLANEKPIESNILIVDGWLTDENLQSVAAHIKSNHYDLIITAGGPITHTLLNQPFDNYADQARFALTHYGISSNKIIAAPAPASAQNRTFLSAVFVRDWLDKHHKNYDSVNLFTQGIHARRSHLLYEMAFDVDINIGVMASKPDGYSLEQWWTSSRGAKGVLMETISLIWTLCCFDPGEKGSHQEKWGIY